MRRKIGISIMTLGAVLILSALFLLVYNRREADIAGQYVRTMLPDVRVAISENMQRAAPETAVPEHINPYDEVALESAQEMTVTQINDSGYVGYITIPVLELELPIRSELDTEGLKLAPCRMTGSYKSNDLVIAGHDYTQHFGKLSLLKTDDFVQFTDMDGIDTVYTVTEIEILGEYQVEEMVSGEWDLTLFTCTYSGKERLTVRCSRYEPE